MPDRDPRPADRDRRSRRRQRRPRRATPSCSTPSCPTRASSTRRTCTGSTTSTRSGPALRQRRRRRAAAGRPLRPHPADVPQRRRAAAVRVLAQRRVAGRAASARGTSASSASRSGPRRRTGAWRPGSASPTPSRTVASRSWAGASPARCRCRSWCRRRSARNVGRATTLTPELRRRRRRSTSWPTGLDDSPGEHWTNCWTPEYLRWRLSSPNGAPLLDPRLATIWSPSARRRTSRACRSPCS